MAMAKAQKTRAAKPNDTPRLKFSYQRKEVTEEQLDKCIHDVRMAARNDHTSAKAFGRALIKLRECMYKHGQFTKWLRANSIDQNRASYCMRESQGLRKKTVAPKNDPLQKNIQWQLGEMYKLANKKDLTLDAMSAHAMEVVHSICARAGRMSDWPMHSPKDENVAQLLASLKKSLDNYLVALFEKKAKAAGSSGR